MTPFIVIIPARRQSTRLPEKLLQPIGEKILLAHTYHAAARSNAHRVIVAADDRAIVDAMSHVTHDILLTQKSHESGTERLAECVEKLELPDETIIVNLQGDEPFMPAEYIDLCAAALDSNPNAAIATLAVPIDSKRVVNDSNAVKVVCNQQNEAMYFSRAPIPYDRDNAVSHVSKHYLHHLGIYAYRASFLRAYQTLSPSPLEALEYLEQLRALWHGYRIAVATVAEAPPKGIDTSEDLQKARQYWEKLQK